MAMGTSVLQIRIELIFRRCWNLITPWRSAGASRHCRACRSQGCYQRVCRAFCGASVSPVVSGSIFIVRFYFSSRASLSSSLVSPTTSKLADSRRELRLRSDLQLFHHRLTMRCDEFGVAAELFGNLFVCLSFGEAPQQLLLLHRQRHSATARIQSRVVAQRAR